MGGLGSPICPFIKKEEIPMNRVKSILLLMLALVMVVGLCACSESGSETPETTTTAPTETTDLQVNGGFAERPTEDSDKIEYVITVKDTEGDPVVGAMVQICKDTCLPGSTDADGVAKFTVTETGHKVSFLTLPSGYAYVDEDITEWYFEDGSYEMTIVLQVSLEDSSK